jgi:twitching motility protein PilU
MMMERLFQLMKEKNASDMFFAVNSPVHIKINGNLIPINQNKLEPENIRVLLAEIASPEQMEELDRDNELNMGISVAQPGPLPPLRLPPARQYLGRVPLRARHDPAAGRTGPAVRAVRTDHGKARPAADRRRDGSGKSTTIASMLDHRNEQRPATSSRWKTRSSTCSRTRNRSSTSARSAATRRASTSPCATRCARRRTAS